MTTARNTQGMVTARRRDSDVKRGRVIAALQRMLREDTPITFAAVAHQARVSTWLVYAPGVREQIAQARTHQQPRPDTRDESNDHARGLRTDLALARAEINKLRIERGQHQHELRLALGAHIDNLAKAQLVTRVDELTAHNTELQTTLEHQRADNRVLQNRVAELEDDLAAARTSLRRMIRAENTSADHQNLPDTR